MDRRAVGGTERSEHPRRGEVVDVVTRGEGHRAVLAEPADAGIDQAGIAPPAFLGPQTQALHHPGPESLHEDVGLVGETAHHLGPVGMLEVHRHRTASPRDDVGVHGMRGDRVPARGGRSV